MNLNLIRSVDVNLNMGKIKHLQIIIQIEGGASRDNEENKDFWLRQELRVSLCPSVCPSVRPSGTSLSKALNLHLSLTVLSQNCLR